MPTVIDTKKIGQDGQAIHPVLFNTSQDGSGTFYFPVVNADGGLLITPTTIIGTPGSFTHTCTTSSDVAVAAKTDREYLIIQNTTSVPCTIAFGEAAVVGKGILLPYKGSYYEMSRMFGNLNRAAIYCINEIGDEVLCGVEV